MWRELITPLIWLFSSPARHHSWLRAKGGGGGGGVKTRSHRGCRGCRRCDLSSTGQQPDRRDSSWGCLSNPGAKGDIAHWCDGFIDAAAEPEEGHQAFAIRVNPQVLQQHGVGHQRRRSTKSAPSPWPRRRAACFAPRRRRRRSPQVPVLGFRSVLA